MMCINNTVRDVLSSHRHRQTLREAVATFSEGEGNKPSPPSRASTEIMTLISLSNSQTWTWTRGTKIWFCSVVVFVVVFFF